MEIPSKLKAKWKTLRTHGDAQKLAELLPGTSDETFNRAIREGKCNDDVFAVMAKFFEDKAELVKQYL